MVRSAGRGLGFTVVEVLLASVILAFAAVAVVQAVAAGQMLTYAGLHSEQAASLAEALMEEVLVLPYEDPVGHTDTPGPEAGEVGRSGFDNADDFHGFSESAGSLADSAGVLLPAAYQTFSRSVTAAYGNQTVTGFSAPVAGLTITVTVQDAAGAAWTLSQFVREPPS